MNKPFVLQSYASYLQLLILCSDLFKVLTKFLQLTMSVLSQLFVLLKLFIHFLKLERIRKQQIRMKKKPTSSYFMLPTFPVPLLEMPLCHLGTNADPRHKACSQRSTLSQVGQTLPSWH